MKNILKETKTGFACIGVLSEKNLKRTNTVIEVGPKDNKKKVETELISGPIVVDIPSGPMKFYVWETQIGYNGKESFRWKMAEAMYEKWNPKIDGNGEKPTRVRIDGTLSPYDRLDKTGEYRYNISYRINSANTRVKEDDEDGLTITLNGYIDSIKKEEKNEEETGRLIMKIMCATYDGKCYPIEAIVDEEASDMVLEGDEQLEGFEVGQTRTNIELQGIFAGGENKEANEEKENHKVSFRKHRGPKVRTNSGSRKMEYYLSSVDDKAVEEPDEETYTDEEGNEKEVFTLYISPETMKKAKKERNIMIENLHNGKPSKSKQSLKERKNELKKQKAQRTVEDYEDMSEDEDEDEFPF